MKIRLKRCESYSNKVHTFDVHGAFPYKTYLMIKGISKVGKYIVVVGSTKLEDIDKVAIRLDIDDKPKSKYKGKISDIIKPNNDEHSLVYDVTEVSIMDVGDNEIEVYEQIK